MVTDAKHPCCLTEPLSLAVVAERTGLLTLFFPPFREKKGNSKMSKKILVDSRKIFTSVSILSVGKTQ